MLAALARRRATPLPVNINFDGTKLALEPTRPKTTIYGIDSTFWLYWTSQKFAPVAVLRLAKLNQCRVADWDGQAHPMKARMPRYGIVV